jgi:hypothetical protein
MESLDLVEYHHQREKLLEPSLTGLFLQFPPNTCQRSAFHKSAKEKCKWLVVNSNERRQTKCISSV